MWVFSVCVSMCCNVCSCMSQGAEGVVQLLQILKDELERAMILCGKKESSLVATV